LSSKQIQQTDFPIHKVQLFSWALLVAFSVVAWLLFSVKIAEGVLIGSLIANLSFLVLKKDLTKIFQGPVQLAKVRFFIKYYLRLFVLAVVLYMLVRYHQVHVIGLLAGLSTVVVGILFTAIDLLKKNAFSLKEAM
jgi:hypothetical protein